MNPHYWLEKTIEKVLKLKSEDDFGKTKIIMSIIEAYEHMNEFRDTDKE